MKLVDDAGKDITGFDVRGELCVRGPTIVRGYFENPEANERDFDSQGFFHTGDIAYIDRMSELYYIVDRKKVNHTSKCRRDHAIVDSRPGADQSPRLPSGSARAGGRATLAS